MIYIAKNEQSNNFECTHPAIADVRFGGVRVPGGTNLVKVTLDLKTGREVVFAEETFQGALDLANEYLNLLK